MNRNNEFQSSNSQNDNDDDDDDEDEFDPDQFLFDKKSALEHFFEQLRNELSSHPVFALHFFLAYSKQLSK
jgi:hypothetical protein